MINRTFPEELGEETLRTGMIDWERGMLIVHVNIVITKKNPAVLYLSYYPIFRARHLACFWGLEFFDKNIKTIDFVFSIKLKDKN